MLNIVGQGRIVLRSLDPGFSQDFSFQISQQNIRFYNLDNHTEITAFDWWASVQSTVTTRLSSESDWLKGHVVLTTLPAAPQPAFTNIAVQGKETATGTIFVLTVQQSESFASYPSGHVAFRDLDLTFTQDSTGVRVSGGVKLVLFDRELMLTAQWQQGELIFTAAGAAISLEQIGELENVQLSVQATHPWEHLQALYTFEAGAGQFVRDTVARDPLDLTIYTPERVVWGSTALATGQNVAIATAPLNSQPPLDPPRAIQKLIAACQETQELSVVLWIKPKQVNQSGLERLITCSADASRRNFLLAQQGSRYVAQLRTTQTDLSGRLERNQNLLQSPESSVKPELTCLVLTRSSDRSSGAEPSAALYINGEPVDETQLNGDFSTWELYELALANEFMGDGRPWEGLPSIDDLCSWIKNYQDIEDARPWEGEFHRIAIYNKALSPEQVQQLYYPHLTTTGRLRLRDMPVPLDQPLPATISYAADHSLLRVEDSTPRLATPQFQFDRLHLSWHKAGQKPWQSVPGGEVAVTLWTHNSFTLATMPVREPLTQRLLLATRPGQSLNLKLEGLGELPVAQLQLQPGSFEGRPQWQLTGKTDLETVVLPNLDRPFDLHTDFKLQSPSLAIRYLLDPLRAVDGDRLVLAGTWLGKPLAFYGLRVADRFLWRSTTTFDLPFNLTLGPIYEPGTTVRVADQVKVCSTPGCRQLMHLNVLIELSANGFVAVVNGEFPWQDGFGRESVLSLPEFTTFSLPTTPNALLAAATAQLTRHADDIFAPVVQSQEDFYAIATSDPPILIYGDKAALPEKQQTILPPVLQQNTPPLTVAPFSLEQTDTEATLTLTLKDQSIATLSASYQQFLEQLSSRVKSPASFVLVKQRLAERLPVVISQGLQFTYGYIGGQTVDLAAGMRLRVEYQNYQFVHPIDKTAETGFVSSGTTYYSLQFDGEVLSFDPFLATVPTALEGPNQGVSGLIDLLRPGYRQPFYRLIYPDQFLPASGRVGAERTALLVGAQDFKTLQQATAYYQQPGVTQDQPPADIALVYFRGRATVVPEIAIFVQEQPDYVPVGTTLQQMLARYGQVALRGRLRRLVHEGTENTPDYRFVNLGSNAAALNLPLIQGDRIYM